MTIKPLLLPVFVTITLADASFAQWFWPPTECSSAPRAATCEDFVAVTIAGEWPNSCIPEAFAATVAGDTIHFDVHDTTAPGTFCLPAILPWSFTARLGALEPGTYTVLATGHSRIYGELETAKLCTFTVTAGLADVDGDGAVGFTDLSLVLAAWGRCAGACPADLDRSGSVGLTDLLSVLAGWGGCR